MDTNEALQYTWNESQSESIQAISLYMKYMEKEMCRMLHFYRRDVN